MILNELKDGTTYFTTKEDGTPITTKRPPTSKELRAARAIEELAAAAEGLARANQTLQNEFNYLQQEYDKLRSLQERQTNEKQPGVRDVPGSPEESGNASEIGQAHEAAGPESEGTSETL